MKFTIERITIAVKNMDAMVKFDDSVFQTNLKPLGTPNEIPFYRGHIAKLELLLGPHVVVKVKASKNRQQFRFIVKNVKYAIDLCIDAGGIKHGEIYEMDTSKIGGVSDPNGNTIEFIQYKAKEIRNSVD